MGIDVRLRLLIAFMRLAFYLPLIAVGSLGGWHLRRAKTPSLPVAAAIERPAPPSARLVAPVAATPAHQSRRVTPDTPLADSDRALLAQDAAREAARQVDETRPARRSECKAALDHPSDELCERVLQANGHAIRRAIEMKQRFLRGEIDQDAFQSEYHQMFLERAVELEQFLSARQFLALEHMGPGDDMFLAVLSGPQNVKNFHLGDDLLDPQLKEPVNEHGADEANR